MDELLAEFLAETTESLAILDDALLKLERTNGDVATLAVVFRLVHTIKGTCGFLALPRLEAVAHATEDLLGAMRDGMPVTPGLITLTLAGVDRIRFIVTGIDQHGHEPAGNDASLCRTLFAFAANSSTQQSAPCEAFDVSPGRPGGDAGADLSLVSATEDAVLTAGQSIRVNVTTLEQLMTLVSELVLTRNQLLQIARTEADSRLNAPLQRLSHLTSDLQEGVMRTRMQPIRHAWNSLPRMVRDLAAELGKQIQLDMRGEDTELDRHVLELIRGPLTHMVRNCADHGLELPAVRLSAGKAARGSITLNSYHEGGTIVIEVGDDGAGLNTARIQAKALSQGLVTAAEMAGWTERQTNRLIFMAGLTTADAVTSVSGRGVGMDVVRTNIEQLGGTVDVRSVAGAGTTFTVRIPLTLAIISALVIDAGGQRFALPQTCVAELVRIDPSDTVEDGRVAVERIDGTPVLRLRNKLVPLVQLAQQLGLKATEAADGVLTVVVAQLGGLVAGLLVDQVFDTEEIVVKPVSRLLRNIPVFSGNTILGDGSVIMILDPSGLARAIGQTSSPVRHQRPESTANNNAEYSGDESAMLLVHVTKGGGPVAVPLSLVARIESIARESIQQTPDRLMTLYRGRLMPLVALAGALPEADPMPVLVFTDLDKSVGLIVAEIVDVVEDQLDVELTPLRPGMLGTAVIAEAVTEVLDTGYWLAKGREDWFIQARAASPEGDTGARLLVVEDNAFFRQLLVPTLSASGYCVTAVDSAAKALALRDLPEPARFDAIISDVEMPGMDGLQLARRLREGGAWANTPLVALSGRCDAADTLRGSEAGFDDYVRKFDRDALLAALRRHVNGPARRAA